MNTIFWWALVLAKASKGNPVTATATIMLFYLAFNILIATVEKLIFGERFEHWGDPIFCLLFIGFSALTIRMCAGYNDSKEHSDT